MTFAELYEALRALAESNRDTSRSWNQPSTVFDADPNDPFVVGPSAALQTWTLQPDQIETLVSGLDRLASRTAALEAAATDFIQKVDSGRARSTDSYQKFQNALATGKKK